ncbi:unnamed protein product [Hymenolepis diminuta]|uniref:Uncharacterized protein n=1 Tax=Hymenolepis diminuta TaxID=6216 RepID=A0A564XXM1_HYMDI|nr:unnamed protein product [Hymenolepis diminuta]
MLVVPILFLNSPMFPPSRKIITNVCYFRMAFENLVKRMSNVASPEQSKKMRKSPHFCGKTKA